MVAKAGNQVLDFNLRLNKTAVQDGSQTAQEFTLRAFLSRSPAQEVLNTFDSSGMNAVDWRAYTFIQSFLLNYNVMAFNNFWRNDYILNPNKVADSIKTYAQSYSSWPYIINWFGQNEPYSTDAFSPMQIVDSLLKAVYAQRLITEFYPPYRLINFGASSLGSGEYIFRLIVNDYVAAKKMILLK